MLTLTPQFETFSRELPEISARELSLYEGHFGLLQHWNEKINLVSRKSLDQSFANHYADSVFIAHHARPFADGKRVYDVGSGAGFPGIIFGIRYPELNLTLFEKSLKKQTFLSAVLEKLSLSHLNLQGAVPPRIGPGLFLCRAVFPREKFFDFFRRCAAPGSVIVMNFGGKDEEKNFPKPFAKLKEIRYSLPAGAGERQLAIVKIVPRGTN